jgi:hypothetical protein
LIDERKSLVCRLFDPRKPTEMQHPPNTITAKVPRFRLRELAGETMPVQVGAPVPAPDVEAEAL